MSSTRRQKQGERRQKGERLTLEECRKALPNTAKLSDEQLLALRDQLYILAEFAISVSPSGAAREDVEERAAIMEFEGGLAPQAAESGALVTFMRRRV